MAKKQKMSVQAFQAIDGAVLDTVTGGRWIPRKGTDPAIITGIKGLVDAVGKTGQEMQAKKAADGQQMQGLMQQMMQKKQGG